MDSQFDFIKGLRDAIANERDFLNKTGLKKARFNQKNFQAAIDRYQSLLAAYLLFPGAFIHRTLRANYAPLLLFER